MTSDTNPEHPPGVVLHIQELHEHNIGDEIAPSDVIGRRIKELRRKRDLTAEQLAARCAEVGRPEISTAVVSDIETGRRGKNGKRRREVTVEELLTLSYVLDVAPVNLMVPIEETGEWILFTPEDCSLAGEVREWIRGKTPLVGQDPRGYFSEVPAREWRTPELTPEQVAQESDQIRRIREAKGGGRRGRR
jgi:transcriptional regulator with XRE-family HTH domain